MSPHILLTVDVEDWFQVENFKPCIPYASWPSRDLRVERNTHRLLDLLDEAISNAPWTKDHGQLTTSTVKGADNGNLQEATCNMHTKNSLSATFFVLGWLAERLPNLVREIHARGHEVASHGYHHELCSGQSCRGLEKDLRDSKKLLEDITGAPVYGYRAPSFSISDDVLKSIEQCGYQYDSSYNSFAMHGRYGKLDLSGNGGRGIAREMFPGFFEIPISNLSFRKPFSSTRPVKFFKKDSEADLTGELSALGSEQNRGCFVLPWGGGAYFRLIPSWMFFKGVHSILKRDGAYLFYMHPWEIDPDQPRPERLGPFSRFKHYTNLAGTEKKVGKLLARFSHCRFITCHEYLKERPL